MRAFAPSSSSMGVVGADLPQRGFTLLEVVIVLVVLGALAGLVYPKFAGPSVFAEASFAEQVATALRYAQRYAVSTGCEVQVSVDAAADTLALHRRAGSASEQACGTAGFSLAMPLPGQSGDYLLSAAEGVDVSAGLTVVFDAQGLPQPGGGTIIVSGRNIIVEAGSGYVH